MSHPSSTRRGGIGPRSRGGLALLLAATTLTLGACGVGPGEEEGNVRLLVTRDFGATQMSDERPSLRADESVLGLLERNASEVETAYGGGFVSSIDGWPRENGDADPGDDGSRQDWFFFVNGSESQVGAARYRPEPGDQVWWDMRDWQATAFTPAVVGAYPLPFSKQRRVGVDCRTGPAVCESIRADLRVAGTRPVGSTDTEVRVLVGTWEELRSDPVARLLEQSPERSGVYARFVRDEGIWKIAPYDATGEAAAGRVRGGLVAALRPTGGQVTWVLAGSVPASVPMGLREADLARRYATLLTLGGDDSVGLPIP